MNETTPTTNQSSSSDQSKIFAIVGYIFPILFFLPLVTNQKGNQFAMFHANQQALLLVLWIVGSVAYAVPVLGWMVAPIIHLVALVFAVLGLIGAVNNETKPLPLIGKYVILK